ncbi:hypothetical protein RM697_07330 [Ichthyenterobacterium sp. W332]|uniref:PKD/Chitinase domain-containing protein n=1 Tax=Microcosmobacter mediterraneus TaxID=3075607 RepID=A0ABU2YKV8_9FLAO|nr:PKD domain-containing protein [Ichthyenterobacterium sp. W332]MDT0558452.1 hypothetical protein [Ichthyenterobacterium sp. W332]
MKRIKNILKFTLVVLAFFGCTQDDDNTDFVDAIAAPTNISASVSVTQDNSGLVTLTPLGEGVTSFIINFGDGSDASGEIQPGGSVDHIYEEGTYEASITGNGINGLSTTVSQTVVVSFQAPQNLVVTIENDAAISKQVNVTAEADFAMNYEVDFGQVGSDPVAANIEDTVSFVYENAGTYTITVTAFSAAIETTVYSEEFVVTEILQPLAAAPNPPNRNQNDVISMFSNAYDLDVNVSSWRSDWSTSILTDTQIDGDDVKFYADADFVGVEFYGADAVDASNMEFFYLDFWSVNATTFRVKLVDLGGDATEAEIVFDDLPQNEWVSLEIPMSAFTDAGMTATNSIQQLIFSGLPTGTFDFFIDNVYFYKSPTNPADGIAGTWRIADEDTGIGVGPAPGDTQWFTCDAPCREIRACYFDDTYVFGEDGSFMNVLGADTWIEGWQSGAGDACGAPIAPHDGSNPATYVLDEGSGTLTLNGVGAYLGVPKANNDGELPMVAVPSSITYDVVLSNNNNTMEVTIEAGGGVFWQYKLIRDLDTSSNPLEGTWQIADEDTGIGVGPAPGDTQWFTCDAPCREIRACYFDDTYIFGADGSFTNSLGADTWIEGWQSGAGDACGAPIAPHDGSNPATFTYNEGAGTLTLNGVGAYLGVPKANNDGELPMVAVPSSITYDITLSDNNNTMEVIIESGAGVFWQYKLVKI